MPIVRIDLIQGRTREQMNALAERIIAAVSDVMELEPHSTQVLFTEFSRDMWATSQTLAEAD